MRYLIFATLIMSSSPAFAGGRPNSWYLNVEKDAFTDQVEAVAAKTATARPTWQGPESIVMRCTDGQFELYVTTNDVLDSDRTQTRIRFDEEEPMKVRVNRSEDGTAVFLKSQLSTLVEKMRAGSKMVVEVEPWRERPRAITFSLAGMTKHLNILAKHCPEAAGAP